MANVIRRQTPAARMGRGLLYGVLILAALFYILPLVVMLMTSVKPLSEISAGSLLSFRKIPPSHRGRKPGAKPVPACAVMALAATSGTPLPSSFRLC